MLPNPEYFDILTEYGAPSTAVLEAALLMGGPSLAAVMMLLARGVVLSELGSVVGDGHC